MHFISAIMRKILQMRSPIKIVQSWFVEEKYVPNTILQQNYAYIDLSESTVNILIKLFVAADSQLYFGVGRNYLFQVYKDLGIIQNDEQTRKFWVASGFYKQVKINLSQRNQKASGVGLVQFLNIFQQGLRHGQKKDSSLTQKIFLDKFINKYIQKAPTIMKWEKQFNRERANQFLKNMPGDNQKKKDAIIQIIRQCSQKNKTLITQQELEYRIKEMGLKGLNLTDKALYWQLKRTWDMVRLTNIERKITHPLATEIQKHQLSIQKDEIFKIVNQAEQKLKQIEQNYENLYKQKIF